MENYWRGWAKNDGHFWHMNCDGQGMARKANTLTVLQEMHGQSQVTNRQPAAELAALYLMQVRTRALKVSQPRRRLRVVTDAETRAEIARPVSITFVDQV
jgi:hypothetical protein